MNEITNVVHHVPGRLRLRVPAAKANPVKMRSIQQSLQQMPGVRRVDVHTALGSVVVYYDPAMFEGFVPLLTDYVAERDLFTIGCAENEPCVSETERGVNRALGDLNRRVQAALGNAINLKELLPLAMGMYGLFFVNRSAAAAQWLNWIQVAFDTYMDLHEGEPVEEVSQKLDRLGSQLLAQQSESMKTLLDELASLRAEVRAISPAPKQ